MQEKEFALRLSVLRNQKGVSARDMSLSIGQNPGYINSIENGKALPSLSLFFYICDYLGVTPSEFFNTEILAPGASSQLFEKLQQLSSTKLSHISALVDDLLMK